MIRGWREAVATAVIAVTSLLPGPVSAGEAKPIRTYLNGRELAFDVPPLVDRGRTLVPARGLFEALGATVTWDPSTRTVSAFLGENELLLRIDDDQAYVNGGPVSLEVPPRILEGRTLIPLRFVSEGLGAGVRWDPEQQAIAIESRVAVARSGRDAGGSLPTGENGAPGGPTKFRAATAALKMALVAQDLVGLPYRWGGTSPAGFDCSGLTQYVAGLVGIELPRTSQDQFAVGEPVAPADLLPGDLLFYTTYAPGPSHVGVYIGNGRFVHALNESTGVTVSEMETAYWRPRFLGARRLLPAVPVPGTMPNPAGPPPPVPSPPPTS